MVQQLEAYVLNPFVMGRIVRIPPVWIVLALLVGSSLLGLLGMFLAVPSAVILRILLTELYLPWRDRQSP
ncbi:hypothetical protein D3C87_1894290 [compost metagenome]